MQTNANSTENYLYSLLRKVEKVDNNIVLNDLFYLGQVAGAIAKTYDFELTSGSPLEPYSFQLIHDLLVLEDQGAVGDTRRPGSIVLGKAEYHPDVPDLKDESKIERLAKHRGSEIRQMAKVIALREEFNKNGITGGKKLLQALSDHTWLDKKTVRHYIKEFEKIKSSG